MKLNYIVIPLITIAVSSAGGFLTGGGMDWYRTINLPEWTPSGAIIGSVWTIIFILAAMAALMVFNSEKAKLKSALAAAFLINAFLNVFWSFLFFNQHFIGAAVFEAALLGVSVLALIVLIRPISRWASLLLYPYFIWVCFATYLTYVVWTLN